MLTRVAVFEGSLEHGSEDAFVADVAARLEPIWRSFPHVRAVRVLRTMDSDRVATVVGIRLAAGKSHADMSSTLLTGNFGCLRIGTLSASRAMGTILQFIQQNDAFDPDTISFLGAAYDSAIAKLNGRANSEVVREIIARRIIAMASLGERDPERLLLAALASVERSV